MVTENTSSQLSIEELRKYSFLTSICHEEHEAYFPTDGGAYLDRSYFRPNDLETIRGYWKKTTRLIRDGRAPQELGLYIHWPFCLSRCNFCFCAMSLSSGRGELRRYNLMLKREIDAFKDLFTDLKFHSIYIGGGTPSLMPNDLIETLFEQIRDAFSLADNAEIYMEASPATLTPEKLKVIRGVGVNHITLGVQSLDSMVLHKTNRIGQNRKNVADACSMLTAQEDMITATDLMYGLEAQTDKSFIHDFLNIVQAGPRNLRVYAFDPRVQTSFSVNGKSTAPDLRAKQWAMVEELDAVAKRFGYETAPLDPDDEDYLSAITRQCRMARKWGASVLGIGMSALSHAFGSAWYGHPSFAHANLQDQAGSPRRWEGIPPSYSMESTMTEEMRGFAVRQLHTQSWISRKGFRDVFMRDILDVPVLARALEDLKAIGKVSIDAENIRFLSKNRLERLVYSKRLFSTKITNALLRGNRSKYKNFCKAYGDEQIRNLESVADKRIASLMRMYYRPRAPRPDWFRNAMKSENTCRLPKAAPAHVAA